MTTLEYPYREQYRLAAGSNRISGPGGVPSTPHHPDFPWMEGFTKSRPWIRLYTEVPDDPKVQGLTGNLFKFWINCLCLAGRNDGWLPPDEQIAWCLREQPSKIATMKRQLVVAGLVDETPEGGYSPHSWNDRQYETDVSTERVRRLRERERKRLETVSANGSSSVCSALSVLSENKETSLQKNPNYPAWYELLVQYPGAARLKGSPDVALVDRCAIMFRGDVEAFAGALRELHLSGKKPDLSWGWFLTVLPQYVENGRP